MLTTFKASNSRMVTGNNIFRKFQNSLSFLVCKGKQRQTPALFFNDNLLLCNSGSVHDRLQCEHCNTIATLCCTHSSRLAPKTELIYHIRVK